MPERQKRDIFKLVTNVIDIAYEFWQYHYQTNDMKYRNKDLNLVFACLVVFGPNMKWRSEWPIRVDENYESIKNQYYEVIFKMC